MAATTATAPASAMETAAAASTLVAPASKNSVLGRELSKEQRVCLLGLVALSMPPEDQALGRWNVLVITTVARLLQLEDGHWMALQPLLHSEGNDPAIRQVQLEAFRKPFLPEAEVKTRKPLSPRGAATAAPQLQLQLQSPPHTPEEEARCHALRRAVLRDLLVHLACAALYDARSRRVLMALAADAFELDWREMARVCTTFIMLEISESVCNAGV